MCRPEDLRLLIVDDDEVDQRRLIRALRKAGAQNPIDTASDGIEALELLRSPEGGRPKWPFIVILDVNMPRMDGHQFLTELRADPDLSTTVVFMFTTSDEQRDIEAAFARHVACYIVKRNSTEDLAAVVALIRAYGETGRFPTIEPSQTGR